MFSPAESLRQLATAGLLRQQRPLDSPTGVQVIREGRTLWNFAANDYLGLARHPAVAAALIEGVQRYGAGAAASRLVCGTLPPHRLLEQALAAAKQSEAALSFSSGFATALGAIPAIVGKSDWPICFQCIEVPIKLTRKKAILCSEKHSSNRGGLLLANMNKW